MHRSLLLIGLSLILFCSCTQISSHSESSPKGNLIMIGGGKRPASIMSTITSLQKDGPFLIVPMASSIADTIGWEHADTLKKYGAKDVKIMMMKESDSLDSDVISTFRNAGGIWFSGGDQNKLMQYVGSNAISEAIYQAYVDGAVIAGTSAGTAVQSELMITGDERFPINDRVYFGQIRTQNTILSKGLGFVKGIIIDQHFIKRSRTNRLVTSLLDMPVNAVAGIDEATALWFKPSNQVQVIGEGQVMVWEKKSSTKVVLRDSLLGGIGIQMHILPRGSSFIWKDRQISKVSFN